MTLRIDTVRDGRRLVVSLVGRIQREHLGDLQRRVAGERRVLLDLGEVSLVDADVVRFLKGAEGAGVEPRRCPPFIQEWIDREQDIEIERNASGDLPTCGGSTITSDLIAGR